MNTGTSLAKTRTARRFGYHGVGCPGFRQSSISVNQRACPCYPCSPYPCKSFSVEEDRRLRIPDPAIELLQQPGLCIGAHADQAHGSQLA